MLTYGSDIEAAKMFDGSDPLVTPSEARFSAERALGVVLLALLGLAALLLMRAS